MQHAMDLLRDRQSDISINVDDTFVTVADQSSATHRGTLQSELSWLPSVRMVALKRGASRPYDATSCEVCAICTETVEAHDRISEIPCGHVFHPDCIRKWLAIRPTCPICRKQL